MKLFWKYLAYLLVLIPVAATAKDYQCELKVTQYTTPRINGYQFFYQSKDPTLKCLYVKKTGNKQLKETGIYPKGKCFQRLKNDPTMSNILKDLETSFTGKIGPYGFKLESLLDPKTISNFDLQFKTNENKSVNGIRVTGIEKSFPVEGAFNISKETPSVILLKGQLRNGIKVRFNLRDKKQSSLKMYASFGRVSAKGVCRSAQ